jgi:O-antigen/teichoic acid export membrane protein
MMSKTVWDSDEVARKSSKAVLALGLRQLFVQGFNIAGGILLARLLSPTEFGVYAICLFLLAFLTTFGDAGLGASLIRQSESPTTQDYRAVFTVQQVLVTIICLACWLIAPSVIGVYKLPMEGIWIFRMIVLAFFVTSFQTIPTIHLERYLAFDRLARIEVSQALVFNTTAVLLAFFGLRELSFGIAIFLRALTGALLANLAHRWDIGWKWDLYRIKQHLSFGIPYQASSILNLLKDLINPLLIGIFSGPVSVGYINWATTVANYPLIFVMLFNRLFMPILARLNSDMAAFNRMLTFIVKILCSFVYSTSIILYIFRLEIVTGVFGNKWLPAVVLFAPFVLITFILAPTIVAIGALNALGKTKFVFFVTLTWVVLTWMIGVAIIPKFGWASWGWVNLSVNFSNLLVLHQVSKTTGFSWFKALITPIVITVICVVTAMILVFSHSPFLLSIFILGLEIFCLMMVFFGPELQKILKNVKSKEVAYVT